MVNLTVAIVVVVGPLKMTYPAVFSPGSSFKLVGKTGPASTESIITASNLFPAASRTCASLVTGSSKAKVPVFMIWNSIDIYRVNASGVLIPSEDVVGSTTFIAVTAVLDAASMPCSVIAFPSLTVPACVAGSEDAVAGGEDTATDV